MSEMNVSDGDVRKALSNDLKAKNLAIHQADDPPLFTAVPQPAMKPWHWKAADIKEALDRVGASVKLEAGGVRRTVRLANPGFPYGTTPTFWCSIQYILPGEVATAHRHTASALRFIMEGEGADTIVDGEQYSMNKGDLVLTPNWAYHDHEHKGSEPMIWLDVLDVTLVRNLEAVFFEGSDVPRRSVNSSSDASYREFGSGIMKPLRSRYAQFKNPLLCYSRERAEAAVMEASGLEPDPFDDTAMEYRNPETAGPAMSTIGTVLQRLRPGFAGKPHRHTGSTVSYVVRGKGTTTVDGQVFEWGPGDFVAIPPWAEHEHSNPHETDAWMFQVNDFPALKALDLWRESER